MRFMMMDANERAAQRKGHGLGCFQTDHECPGKAGALSGGDSSKICRDEIRLSQGPPSDGKQVFKVFASSQFGNYASIFLVHLDLRGNDARQNAAVVNYGSGRFITGCFNGKEHVE